jgi:hypothetical protein
MAPQLSCTSWRNDSPQKPRPETRPEGLPDSKGGAAGGSVRPWEPWEAPTAAAMPDLVDLVMEVLQDPARYRRFIGRLRPKLVGRPHPRRRLPRLRGAGILHRERRM